MMTHFAVHVGPGIEYQEVDRSMAPVPPAPASRSGKWPRRLVAAMLVVSTWLVVGGVAAGVTARHANRPAPSHPAATVTPLQQWWLQAKDDFTEVQHVSADVRRGIYVFLS